MGKWQCLRLVLVFFLAIGMSGTWLNAKVQVGEIIEESFETPHPYPAQKGELDFVIDKGKRGNEREDINAVMQGLEDEEKASVALSYCDSKSNNSIYEWIKRVEIGPLSNLSGRSQYSDFTSLKTISNPGQTLRVSLTPGYDSVNYFEYWRIWIDYNKNGSFETSEKVFEASGTGTVTGSFMVPTNISGKTRLRVSMKWGGWPTPCGTFNDGEVEDYSALIYCTSAGDSQNYEWIRGVRIGDLNNISGPSPYTDFTHLKVNLERGKSHIVELTPGYSGAQYIEHWTIWIDFNMDGDFTDPGELVLHVNGQGSVQGSIYVPERVEATPKRMRVAMRYGGEPPVCGMYKWGEVEDYSVTNVNELK